MAGNKTRPVKRATKPLTAPAIPDPFEPAPESLAPLLDNFDKSSVYITHVDNHPAWFKKRVFTVPLGLNVAIALLILWRVYSAGPWYWAVIMSVLGNENETTIHWAALTWGQLLGSVAWRAGVFLFDWLVITVIGPWPWTFFAESPGNPVSWRLSVGFREKEVYVRESRGWGAKDLLGEAEGSSGKAGADSPFFKTRILPAVDRRRLTEKTGYLLMDKDFDLVFGAMVDATRLIDRKTVSVDDFRTSVFVWVGKEDAGQWVVWPCGKLDDGSETEAREKIILFKDRLTAMGKESLFFKWIELVQYESSAPGEFTYERQAATAEKAKQLFENAGVDFDAFVKDIGGLQGMPGMD
ncbi:uncharacterized protein CC84DRAFT_522224 [Paraphaeosphaeria sporulosa]|uniref:Uncharacterized protein n=1 Tax=Paraphaeosphaeria sporulosa TaxID=1460663 RepID=A0A177CK52_9PLEO|nr:uncharacterized protein CC84DRAFT_522224 [Paraphaeosphaeria sporulosa]OAG07895.1 hypothetical protein CC84DRAFT_522224 [Paraphaeosphaeria sporulosa]